MTKILFNLLYLMSLYALSGVCAAAVLSRCFHNIAMAWCAFLRLAVDGCQPRFVFSRQELFAIRRISPLSCFASNACEARERGWCEGSKPLKNLNFSSSIILPPLPSPPPGPTQNADAFCVGTRPLRASPCREGRFFNRPLSKPGKGIRFLEFVSLPPPQPSPTGEGAVLRQIQITAAVSHMDSYETVAIFAANEFPPPVGEG